MSAYYIFRVIDQTGAEVIPQQGGTSQNIVDVAVKVASATGFQTYTLQVLYNPDSTAGVPYLYKRTLSAEALYK